MIKSESQKMFFFILINDNNLMLILIEAERIVDI